MATNFFGQSGGVIVPGADDVFEGSHISETDRAISPERAMWIAVVGRAWLDAFEASDAFLVQSERKAADPDLLRGNARRWLVLDFGDWKADRQYVCDLAGISPKLIRDAARRRLQATRIAAANDLDTAFLRLVECSESLDATELDRALAALAALENAAA